MFTVRWQQSALNELTVLWTEADSERRRAITQATHLLDQRLQSDPETLGESRPNNCRIFFAPPLGILFRVYPQQGVVRVLRVWQF
jgi:hypothetical protein